MMKEQEFRWVDAPLSLSVIVAEGRRKTGSLWL